MYDSVQLLHIIGIELINALGVHQQNRASEGYSTISHNVYCSATPARYTNEILYSSISCREPVLVFGTSAHGEGGLRTLTIPGPYSSIYCHGRTDPSVKTILIQSGGEGTPVVNAADRAGARDEASGQAVAAGRRALQAFEDEMTG